MQKYHHAALGGTFDLLHAGHIALIDKAFALSKLVTIGLTTDNFAKKNKSTFQNYATRLKNLKAYLASKNYLKRTKLITLEDIYGNATKDKSLDLIVVSKETSNNAEQINKARTKSKLNKLKVVIVTQVLAKDRKPINSTRIRSGEISKEGKNYLELLYKISGKQLPQTTRAKLKIPFGKIVKIDSKLKSYSIVGVGDITVSNLIRNKILPKISIVDFYVERKLAFNSLTQLGFGAANADVIVKNEAGQISKNLIISIKKALDSNNSSVIVVDGEEDLATIPAILLSPLGTKVIYGQPHKGAVLVEVETNIKDKLCKLLGI
ncbi:MAG TPA: pantetheine-phosphate adenylyltransferase [Candidatus Saccharimonadales bacterium]|nr:pantetheine-phosphate adenylyltransferase [Candidatus Saccharimonadales bacterium]